MSNKPYVVNSRRCQVLSKDLFKWKLTWTFIFTLLCDTSKRFYKGSLALMKFFKVLKTSLQVKIYFNFIPGIGTKGANNVRKLQAWKLLSNCLLIFYYFSLHNKNEVFHWGFLHSLFMFGPQLMTQLNAAVWLLTKIYTQLCKIHRTKPSIVPLLVWKPCWKLHIVKVLLVLTRKVCSFLKMLVDFAVVFLLTNKIFFT